MADNPIVSNSYVSNNPDIPVRATGTATNKYIQHIRLDLGSGSAEAQATGTVPVSGTVSTSTASYSLRYDEGATYTYIGNAEAGSATSSAVWQIKRLTNADNTILFADGTTSFDNVWDDRLSLTYS